MPEKLSNEHYQKLYRFQDEVLGFIERFKPVFFLGGGTALSRFFYKHRYSDDPYFFVLEENDFIEVVQDIHQKLEDSGYRVSTYGFTQTFCRISLEEPGKYPGFPLKCDFIAARKNTHIGDFITRPIFSAIDNPRNILAEKLSFIYKKSPKDIADIWTICRNLSFNWEEALEQANRKRTTVPLLVAEAMEVFPAADLKSVRWIRPIQVEHFKRVRDIIVHNIIT
ncbi:MAG: nucleotidyl transferase AbiEii/AbiGii toxin family protein [bacterium]|nr:nucleotidyl transferase AbiEii/AbiGii toxin family protein [bacterium]